MEIKYDLTGTNRKALAQAVSEIAKMPLKELGAPSFAYQIGDLFTVREDGILVVSDKITSYLGMPLFYELYERGFIEVENNVNTTKIEIKYNLMRTDRKALVKAVSDIAGKPSKYLGAPSFAYQIGDWYTITREGTLKISNYTDREEVERLLGKLYERGYEAEKDEKFVIADADKTDEDFKSKTVGYSIGLPIAKLSDKPCSDKIIENLKAIIVSKMSLFQKAIGTDKELKIEWDRDTIWFDWFDELQDAEKAELYMALFKALYQMAEKAVRVTAKEKPIENEKFAMRTFLNRIGLSGKEYKPLRKELMKNLSGDGAFRYGRPNKTNTDGGEQK